MGLKKLSEEIVSENFTGDAHLLVTQTEEVDGESVHVVRRVPATGDGGLLKLLPVSAELTDLNEDEYFFRNKDQSMSRSLSDGVASFSKVTNKSAYSIQNDCGLTAGKHMIGFAFKITKSGTTPSLTGIKIRFESEGYDPKVYDLGRVEWSEWIYFNSVTEMQVDDVRLTVSFNSSVINSFTIYVKEMYIYDVEGVDDRLFHYIKEQQKADYSSGSVTYETEVSAINTDPSMAKLSMPADAKATGERLAQLTSSIAEKYDSFSIYAVGDYCTHESTLYRCTTAITMAEQWTSAHWTATTVIAEVKRMIQEAALTFTDPDDDGNIVIE